MSFNERAANKLDQWFSHTRVKQMHIVIIERVFALLWREWTSANTAACIRLDRGRQWWHWMKNIPTAGRKHLGSVH